MTFLFAFILSFFTIYLYSKSNLTRKAHVFQTARAKAAQYQTKIEDLEKQSKIEIEDIQAEAESRLQVTEVHIQQYEQGLQQRSKRVKQMQAKLSKQDAEIKSLEEQSAQANQSIFTELEAKARQPLDEVLSASKLAIKNQIVNFLQTKQQGMLKHYERKAQRISAELIKESMQIFDMESSVDRLSKFVDLTKKQFKNATREDFQLLNRIAEKLDVTIEALENSTSLKVSGFILWNQEVAKKLVMKLTQISKINLEALDKLIEKERQHFDEKLRRLGQKIAKRIQLEQSDPEFLLLLGRMKFRTSYGQNILYHSFEVAYFCQFLASQIGEDPRTAFLAGFFHDFGKTVDQAEGGSHDLLGAELLKKFGFEFEVYHPAHSHHYLVPIETVIGELVVVADKISSSRQGARSESAEMYYARVEGLERIAGSHEEVKKGFALSAAREVRCLLHAKKITDEQMQPLADKMVKEIEEELTYPGKIKVNLIRSVDAVEYANKASKK